MGAALATRGIYHTFLDGPSSTWGRDLGPSFCLYGVVIIIGRWEDFEISSFKFKVPGSKFRVSRKEL